MHGSHACHSPHSAGFRVSTTFLDPGSTLSTLPATFLPTCVHGYGRRGVRGEGVRGEGDGAVGLCHACMVGMANLMAMPRP